MISAMHNIVRCALVVMSLASLALQAGAQSTWPTRPIKLVVPFAPGGSNDNIARVLATKLGARLGQPVVVENRAGGGGTIGTEYVVKSATDGHTLLLASASISTNVASGKKLGYHPLHDLTPIGGVAATPFAIVVTNDLGVGTLKELLALARSKPGSINYGSAGMGGMNHLATELLAATAKVQFLHVPYRGIGPAFTDLLGGSLQMLMPSVASVLPHIRAGKMRALAVTSAQRSPMAPDIPTASEAGLPGFELEVWYGLLGPARMPAAVVKRLNEELNVVLGMADVQEILAREACRPTPGSPEKLHELMRSELDRWGRLIKENQIQME
jgi:tripartite-type tricarboxylate transporter receptor subunit TctC